MTSPKLMPVSEESGIKLGESKHQKEDIKMDESVVKRVEGDSEDVLITTAIGDEGPFHSLPSELVLKIMRYDQVEITGIATPQPSSIAVGLGLTSSKYYNLLKCLFPSAIFFKDNDETSKVVGHFLGPDYRFLKLVGQGPEFYGSEEYSEAVHDIFGLCSAYGKEEQDEEVLGDKADWGLWRSKNQAELQLRRRCHIWRTVNASLLVQQTGRLLPCPYNISTNDWYRLSYGIVRGTEWKSMLYALSLDVEASGHRVFAPGQVADPTSDAFTEYISKYQMLYFLHSNQGRIESALATLSRIGHGNGKRQTFDRKLKRRIGQISQSSR